MHATSRSTCHANGSRRAAFAAAFALASVAARADVLVVDSTGLGDFTEIQPAVDAAADGDTLLLRRPPLHPPMQTPLYAGFVIDGKSLTVVGTGEAPLPTGPVTVANLALGQSVLLSYLAVFERLPYEGSNPAPAAVGLTLRQNDGTVVVESCRVKGWDVTSLPSDAVDACRIVACDDVIISDTSFFGGLGHWSESDGGDGIDVLSSVVFLYDSEVIGGAGGFEPSSINDSTGGRGGDGLRLSASFLYASRCSFRGGDGGCGSGLFQNFGGDGGDGVSVTTSVAHAIGLEARGGEGGLGGTAGTDGVGVLGLLNLVPGSPPLLEAPRHVEEGAPVELVVRGQPGDRVQVLTSSLARTTFIGPRSGAVHGVAPQRVDVGAIAANGKLAYTFPAPPTAGGSLGLHLQALVVSPAGTSILTQPEHTEVLDEALAPSCGGRVYVDVDAPPGGDGASWATALSDLAAALAVIPDCPDDPTQVWVAEGTYRPELPGGDPSVSFFLHPGVHVFGGFAGHETSLAERDPTLHPVVLSGDLADDDGPDFANMDENAFHVVRAGNYVVPTKNVRLDGVVIEGGNARGPGPFERSGGAVLVFSSDLTVADTVIQGNYANSEGSGVYLARSGDFVVTDTIIRRNHVEGFGGGIGSSLYASGTMQLTNSLIVGNSAPLFRAGVVLRDIAGFIRNCTFYGNDGGGLFLRHGDSLVVNSIFWDNPKTFADEQHGNLDPPFPWDRITYSCIGGWDGSLGGPTNTGAPPRFVDPLGPDGVPGTADDDLRLDPGSVCIDSGSNPGAPKDVLDTDGDGDEDEPVRADLNGEARFVDRPGTPDSGLGASPIIDMGPYEHQGG